MWEIYKEWPWNDRDSDLILYEDVEGVNLVYCRYGSKIPRIKIYIGLTKPIPAVTELLKVLGTEKN